MSQTRLSDRSVLPPASEFPAENLPDDIFQIAEKCKLSTLTIQKLISIVKMNGSYEITTNELANHLGVTVRNANRILRNLENGGAATIAAYPFHCFKRSSS